MRMNLKVPFAEKDEAKKLGARWDAARKIWYIENAGELASFSRWTPTPHANATAGEQSPQIGLAKNQQATGKVFVGSDYVEKPVICPCLPWEVCEKCHAP